MKKLLVLCALAVGLVLGAATPASADVNDFQFTSFDGQYQLSTDAAGHSQLTTVETLVADFPEFDQNHGIRRNLVERYDGHPTDLHIVSVTDENGRPRSYDTESEDSFLSVTIADKDFVHRPADLRDHLHAIQRHPILRRHERRRVLLGHQRNRLGPAVRTGERDGAAGREPGAPADWARGCRIRQRRRGRSGADRSRGGRHGHLLRATPRPGENLTFAIGFEPGTFTPRDSGFFAAPWPLLTLLFAAGGLAAGIGALVIRITRLRDAPGRGIIIPEYMPPKGVTLLLSALILHRTSKSTAAQIIGLAVAGNLRILEVSGHKPSYRLEFVTDSGADADELEFLHALFGTVLTPGEDRNLKKTDQGAVKKIAALTKRVRGGHRQRISSHATDRHDRARHRYRSPRRRRRRRVRRHLTRPGVRRAMAGSPDGRGDPCSGGHRHPAVPDAAGAQGG